jgi:hypothetical protein
MEFYLKEAFQSLKLLEDDFNLTADQGVIDELQSFVADDIEAPAEEEIIDVEADEVEDLQDNYIGKVILECDSCHTRIYKDIADVIIDEDSGLANVEEECPVCSNAFGWNVIGRIEKFDADAFKEEPKDEEEVEVEEEPEISDEEIGEALKEALNEDRFEDGSVDQEMLNGDVYNALSDVAYENEVNGGTNTKAGFEKAEKNFNDKFFSLDDRDFDEDIDVHVDQPEDSDDVAINVDADDELHEEFEDPDKVGVDPDRAVEDDHDLETPMENPTTEIPDKLVVNESKLTEDAHAVRELVSEYLNDKLVDLNDNLAFTIAKDIPDYNPEWCNEEGFGDLVDAADLAQDEYTEALLNLLFANAPTQESLGEDLKEVQSEDAEKLIDPEEEPVKESLLREWRNPNYPDDNGIDVYRGASIFVTPDNIYTTHDSVLGNITGKTLEEVKNKIDDIAESGRAGKYKPSVIINSKAELDKWINGTSSRIHLNKENSNKFPKLFTSNSSYDGHFADSYDEVPEDQVYRYKFDVQTSLFDESLKEDLNEVEVHTDEQDIEVKTEDGKVVVEVGNPEEPESTAEDEMIAPLDAEEITDIENNEEQSAEEVAAEEEPAEDELDIDEFDEESFDEIGESYLHRVYENVNSFKTTGVTLNKGQLVVEGLIKFNSGKEKKTSFVFEGFKNTKRGKVVTEGKNETFSKSNKAFVLKGTLSDKKFISESLIYNYTAKTINESNESEATRVYGRAVRK